MVAAMVVKVVVAAAEGGAGQAGVVALEAVPEAVGELLVAAHDDLAVRAALLPGAQGQPAILLPMP